MPDYEIEKLDQPERNSGVDETEVYLDAMSVRSKLEFDPEFARSIANLVDHAARIVEDSRSIDRDKPPPHSIQSPQVYKAMLIQQRAEVQRLQAATDAARLRREIAQQKAEIQRIATRVQLHGVKVSPWNAETARDLVVHGTSMAGSRGEESSHQEDSIPAQGLSVGRILVIGGIPVATLTLGVTLVIESATRHPIVPNPYVALFILLAGFALLATAVAAIRERRER